MRWLHRHVLCNSGQLFLFLSYLPYSPIQTRSRCRDQPHVICTHRRHLGELPETPEERRGRPRKEPKKKKDENRRKSRGTVIHLHITHQDADRNGLRGPPNPPRTDAMRWGRYLSGPAIRRALSWQTRTSHSSCTVLQCRQGRWSTTTRLSAVLPRERRAENTP